MQLLGQNLSEVRKKQPNGRFSLATTALLGRQMLNAIQALHDRGYLHRDVKPVRYWRS
jgi:tau tubulin kinase